MKLEIDELFLQDKIVLDKPHKTALEWLVSLKNPPDTANLKKIKLTSETMNQIILTVLALTVISCSQPQKNTNEKATVDTEIQEVNSPTLNKIWESDTVLSTAESVLYDQKNSVLELPT